MIFFLSFQNLYLYDCFVSASVSNYFTELFPEKTKPQLWFVSQIIETTTKKGEIFSLFFSPEAQQITEWFAVVWGLFFGSLVEAQLLENGRE